MKARLTAPLKAATSVNIPAAHEIRRNVDKAVWHSARMAVHRQVAAELETREANADWQRKKTEIGNYAWDQVWQTIGDPVYTNTGWDDDAKASRGLFEDNLKPWADAMMEGQFSAGIMAQLDALNLLTGLDLAAFQGLQQMARSCGWWWAYDSCVVFCERPAKIDINGKRVTMEFRDGWRVG